MKDNPNDSNYLWKLIRSHIPKSITGAKPFVKKETMVADAFNDFFQLDEILLKKFIHWIKNLISI